MDEADNNSRPPPELTQLRSAARLASEGDFAKALSLLVEVNQGSSADLAELAGELRSLIRDYQVAVEQSELAIEEFRVSKRELLQKLQTIEEQQTSIRKLSAPIIDVWERIIAVPLIGILDEARAHDLSERVLSHIQRAGIAWVILDLTGIEHVDGQVAGRIFRLASAVSLMGAKCLLTGMRAAIAQLMATFGHSLDGLHSVPTIREGLKYCLSRSAR